MNEESKMEEQSMNPEMMEDKPQEAPKNQEPTVTNSENKPPLKKNDYEGWFNWYRNNITKRVSEGRSMKEIQEEFKVNPKRFLD